MREDVLKWVSENIDPLIETKGKKKDEDKKSNDE